MTIAPVRMTLQVQTVLRVMLDDPSVAHYGLEIAKAASLPSGTLYPILTRLEKAGWIRGSWEDIDTAAAGRPARRYYELTGGGLEQARAEIDRSLSLLQPKSETGD